MALRFNPRFRFGPFTLGKRGVSVRTGIPGLTVNTSYEDFVTQTGGNTSYTDYLKQTGQLSEEPEFAEYSVSNAIVSMLIFLGLLGALMIFFGFLGSRQWFFLMPFFFLYNPLTMIFGQYIYGEKEEYIKKSDGRYKLGYKIVGTRTVEDRSNKILYTPESASIRRITGSLKLMVVAIVLLITYPIFKESSRLEDEKARTDSIAAIKPVTPQTHHKIHGKKHRTHHSKHQNK
ncbi:hypothetical protein A6C57_01060 [Fibrella sp. ES10-3-2-2]|nr:hypothetical protein A6C57_01060 [Fibrella sp. ES10-3-2-2]